MNKEQFVSALNALNIIITSKQLDELNIYYKRLIEYNCHTNLTRIVEENDVYLKHFYDSLTIIKEVKLDSQTLLDVGTGAGFPGLVLKIIFPNLKVTLLDSLNKRIVFLQSIIDELKLQDVVAIHSRAEDFIVKNREKYDIVTSRAVARLNILSELCIPFVKLNGYFIPMKADLKEELLESKNAVQTLGCVLIEANEFQLPFNGGTRTIIKYEKTSKTDIKYPRKFAEIKKKPL